MKPCSYKLWNSAKSFAHKWSKETILMILTAALYKFKLGEVQDSSSWTPRNYTNKFSVKIKVTEMLLY